MAEGQKSRRRRSGFMDGPDQILKLNSIYRTAMFGHEHASSMAQTTHAQLDDVVSPEPGEDLDESELSDRERREAIARERWRREGRG